MAYRDGFENCPRCGVALVDARSARGCQTCGGMWVDEAVLAEMVQEMRPPGPLQRLHLAVMDRSEAPIACPSCREPMHQTKIHDVILDRCPKHGIWFDKAELGTALLRLGDPALEQPLVEQAEPVPDYAAPTELPELTFTVATPGQAVREVRLRRQIIKIGNGRASHVPIDDPRVSRIHAVIECSLPAIIIVDLGSSEGTLVNGARITKHELRSGDRIVVGATSIELKVEP